MDREEDDLLQRVRQFLSDVPTSSDTRRAQDYDPALRIWLRAFGVTILTVFHEKAYDYTSPYHRLTPKVTLTSMDAPTMLIAQA